MPVNYKQVPAEQMEFVPVAAEDDLPNGERMFVSIDQHDIVVFNIAGQIFAIGDLCSHDDGPIGEGELTGHSIACPRHGADFDVRNGHVLSLPAVVNIPAFPTRIHGGQIEIGVPQ